MDVRKTHFEKNNKLIWKTIYIEQNLNQTNKGNLLFVLLIQMIRH